MSDSKAPEHATINDIRGHIEMGKTSPAQLKALKKYQAKMIVQIKIALHRTIDADILEVLDSMPNKTGYIKDLIRKDIASRQGKE